VDLGVAVLTFAAVVLLIAGLLLMKTWPIAGFLVLVAAMLAGGKAVKRPGDIEWFMGCCLALSCVYSVYLYAVKLL
jgi:hypothetical protein